MAVRTRGLTVTIDGDTTGLTKALANVNKEVKNTQAQLKDVDKLLKLDPTNTELLSQKQRLLGDAIGETRTKLDTLKTASEQANISLQKGEITQEQYDALQREIIETTEELKKLEEQAKRSGVAVQEIAAKGEKLKEMGNKVTNVGKAFMPATVAIAGLGAAAVKTASDFDTQMSKVQAISGATGKQFDDLKAKAREMGSKTKFSASEAGAAFEYMAMAGWKTEDMLDGIEGIMNLAAASGEDLATTSDIVTDALTAFGLSAKDSGHFADILAAASSNANTNVSMMGETFKYAAPIAGALGYTAEDTALAIGLMANAGIKSSQAGTSLRKMMTELQGEIKISGQAIGDVTIQTTNADGSMRELNDILMDCRAAFAGLTESEKASAAEALVGKTAMSGFLAIMNASEEDVNKLATAIGNCDGASQKMADTMQDNLEGQLTKLKSALQELAISFGEILIPVVRDIVAHIQKFVDWLNSLDEGTRKFIVKLALLVAAIGPVLIVVGKVMTAVGTIMTWAPKIAGMVSTVMGWGPKIASAIGVVKNALSALWAVCMANPIILIIAAIAALVAAFIYLWNHSESFRQFWINLWENIKQVVTTVVEAVSTFLTAAWDAIKMVFETVWTAISEFFTGIWNGICNVVTTVTTAISTAVTTAWTAIYEFFEPLLSALQYLFETIWQAIQILVHQALEAISLKIQEIWNGIVAFLTPVLEGIRDFFQRIWDAIKNAVSTALNAIKTAVTTVWNGIKSFLSPLLESIKTNVSNAWNNMKTSVSTAMNNIKSNVSNVWNQVKSGVSSSVTQIYNAVQSGFNNAVSFIRGLIGQAFSWGRDLIMGIVNGIRNAIGAVASACRSVADTIRSYLHFSVPDIGPLTDYEAWMPDFMKGLAKGIEKSKGVVAEAMNGVAAGMNLSPMLATDGNGTIAAAGNSENVMFTRLMEAISGMNGESGGDITIPVYIGQDRIDEIVVTAAQRAAYRSGGR